METVICVNFSYNSTKTIRLFALDFYEKSRAHNLIFNWCAVAGTRPGNCDVFRFAKVLEENFDENG